MLIRILTRPWLTAAEARAFGLLACLGAITPAAWAQTAPTVVFSENFENNADNTPLGAKAYNNLPSTDPNYAAFPNIGYTGVGGRTYTGSPDWINGSFCNGIILSADNSSEPAWAHDDKIKCSGGGPQSYANLLKLVEGMGMLPGNLGRAGHMVSTYTECNRTDAEGGCKLGNGPTLAGGSVVFQTASSITVPARRFYTFSVDAGAVNCGYPQQPRYQFQLIDSSGAGISIGTPINPCRDEAGNNALATFNVGGKEVWAVRRDPGAAFKYADSSLGIRMYNGESDKMGNDGGFDNVVLLDVTPALSKAFSPAQALGGSVVKMVFTVTNRTDLNAKAGWRFTDTLAPNLTLADTTVGGTCTNYSDAAGTTAELSGTAGAAAFTVSGSLPNQAPSCTVEVNVRVADSTTSQQLQNCAANISNNEYIDLPAAGAPGCATLEVAPNIADLYITKTNAAQELASGSTVDYTITVGNKGPGAADNAVIHDPVPTGLTCDAAAAPTCSGTNNAVCPSGVTNGALQSAAGVAIPTLPADSTLTFTMRCTVN